VHVEVAWRSARVTGLRAGIDAGHHVDMRVAGLG